MIYSQFGKFNYTLSLCAIIGEGRLLGHQPMYSWLYPLLLHVFVEMDVCIAFLICLQCLVFSFHYNSLSRKRERSCGILS